MTVNVAAEVAACLKSAPVGDFGADQVKAWLFTSQGCTAARLCRILQDKDARKLLTNAGARTWQSVKDPKGKAQRLWARLNCELVPLAKSKAKALQAKVDFAPKGLLASIFPQAFTYRDVASACAHRCARPLARKLDLISHCGDYSQDVAEEAVKRWALTAHRKNCAVPIPPLGDYVAPLVLHRLGMMIDVLLYLRWVLENRPEVAPDDLTALDATIQADAQALRGEIWDSPAASECAWAMGMLQVYLALETRQPGYAADWSVVPWPESTDSLGLTVLDRPEDEAAYAAPKDRLRIKRDYVLAYTFQEALKTRPGEVANIVKGGLEWLASSLAAMRDDFADVEGLPAEIASILKRGDFPALSDDEYAKVGAWLTANARKHYDGLDSANIAKTRRMEEAKTRLRGILGYNATLRQSAAPGAGAGAGAVAQADSKEQPWADDAPEYLPLSEARKLIEDRKSLSALSKLLTPNGEMRYMRKGQRCKIHVADFMRYMKGRQNDPQWAKDYLDFREAVGKGDRRWFWRCKSCRHEYAENATALERCPKCHGEVELTPQPPPKRRR